MAESLQALIAASIGVLETADADEKAAAAAKVARATRAAGLLHDPLIRGEAPSPPKRPARPDRPELLPPRSVPKRSMGSEQGRAALLHALAHIELNAIDLAFDMIARFAGTPTYLAMLGAETVPAFIADWLNVGEDEARHFSLLHERLATYNTRYGDLPAHDGLWEAAEETAEDFLARLAVVPMVLEARGLDVTPGMAKRMEAAGDLKTAHILAGIYADEINHVRVGTHWFCLACTRQGLEPIETFHEVVGKKFRGRIKPPFNEAARSEAGLLPPFYKPLA